MSGDQLFQQDDNSVVKTAPATETPVSDGEKKYFEELVGEGKKFSDAEQLAKSKAASDAFIEQLKKENEGLRGELSERLAVEKFVDQVAGKTQTQVQPTPSSTNVAPAHQQASEGSQGEITTEDLSKLVEQAINQKMSEAQKQANVNQAMTQAQRKYGENYKRELSQKAQELGLGTEFLASIAEQNPQTFNKLMGLEDVSSTAQQTQASTEQVHTPGSDRVTPDSGSTTKRKYSEFEDLRKADPVKYWSPAVQNELMRLTAEQGEEFFQ